jgi:hypothetical protein
MVSVEAHKKLVCGSVEVIVRGIVLTRESHEEQL